jgi:hypothetical protein
MRRATLSTYPKLDRCNPESARPSELLTARPVRVLATMIQTGSRRALSDWAGSVSRRTAEPPTRKPVSDRMMCRSPRYTTRRHSVRACRPKWWVSARLGRAGSWPSRVRRRSAAASPSTRRAAWSPRVTRWERPGSLRSMNSLDSFAVRAERARYPARALPLPRMAVGGGRYIVDGVGRQ